MEFENTLEFLQIYASKLETDYISKLRLEGYDLANNVEFNVVKFGTKYTVVLNAPEYWKWVEEGRKPGKFPPSNVLINWISRRSIQPRGGITVKSLAFLIGRKISTQGIKPKYILRDTIKQNTGFKEELMKNFKLDIQNYIKNEMKLWQSK